jgi:hypothetical protein
LFSSQTSALHYTSSSGGQSGFENQHPDSCAGFLRRREGKRKKVKMERQKERGRRERDGGREGGSGKEENLLGVQPSPDSPIALIQWRS